MKKLDKCPLCNMRYSKRVKKTRHHIFPRAWYHNSTLLVDVCSKCHEEFNQLYRMDIKRPWSRKQCLQNWIDFCRKKGKEAFNVYPQILEDIAK